MEKKAGTFLYHARASEGEEIFGNASAFLWKLAVLHGEFFRS